MSVDTDMRLFVFFGESAKTNWGVQIHMRRRTAGSATRLGRSHRMEGAIARKNLDRPGVSSRPG